MIHRFVILLGLVLIAGPAFAQSYLPDNSAIVQDARRTQWNARVGLDSEGGIPTYTGVTCASLGYTITTDGTVNEATDINNCLADAGLVNDRAAVLPAGTILVSGTDLVIPSRRALRGAGSGYPWMAHALTSASVASGASTLSMAKTTGFPDSGAAFIEGTDRFTYTGRTATSLTGVSGILAHSSGVIVHPDSCQGQPDQTCLLMVNARITMDGGSKSANWTPGAGTGRNITAGYTKDSTSITVSDTTGVVAGTSYIAVFEDNDTSITDTGGETYLCEDNGASAHCRQSYHKVTGVAGSVLTISPPIPFVGATPADPEYRIQTMGVSLAGVENLKLQGNRGTSTCSLIFIEFARNVWVKNVETHNVGGSGCSGGSAHVWIAFSHAVEVRDSRFAWSATDHLSGRGYALRTLNWNSHHKIENNVLLQGRHGVVLEGCSVCYVGYNLIDEMWEGGGSDNFLTAHLMPNHGAWPHMNLMEGNRAGRCTTDFVHGNSAYQVYFRNWCTGMRENLDGDSSTPTTVSSTSRVAFQIASENTEHSLVGNVAGNSSWTSGTSVDDNTSTTAPKGFMFGRSGSNSSSSYTDTEAFSTADWGTDNTCSNYDYVRDGISFITGSSAAANTCTLALPNSLYFAAKPNFFGSLTWPSHGPTPTTETIPALHCLNLNLMPDCLVAAGSGPVAATRALSFTNPANTSHTVTMPSGLVSPDVAVCAVMNDAASTQTMTGWTEGFNQVLEFNTGRLVIWYRKSDGTEGANETVTTSAARTLAAICYRFTGIEDPANRPPTFSAVTLGNSAAPDSPAVSPTDGGLAYGFLTIVGMQGSGITPTAPTNYGTVQSRDANGAVPQLISAERAVIATSENPGAWSLTGGNVRWAAVTMAVQPSSPPPPTTPFIASTAMTCATCTSGTGRVWPGQVLQIDGTDFGTNTGSARVVITDAAAWPDGVQVNQTISGAWTDTRITATAVQGAHTTLAGKYLYVVNSSDVANTAGLPLTLAPACSNGVDDDADTLIDFAADPGCSGTEDTDETDAPAPPPPGARVFVVKHEADGRLTISVETGYASLEELCRP